MIPDVHTLDVYLHTYWHYLLSPFTHCILITTFAVRTRAHEIIHTLVLTVPSSRLRFVPEVLFHSGPPVGCLVLLIANELDF